MACIPAAVNAWIGLMRNQGEYGWDMVTDSGHRHDSAVDHYDYVYGEQPPPMLDR